MLTKLLLSALTATVAVTGLAIPQTTTTGGPFPPWPSTASITYYPTSCGTNTSCTAASGNDTMSASMCTILSTSSSDAALGIAQAPQNQCSLTLYKGTTYCGGEAEKVIVQIPEGDGTVCVDLGVGEGEKASAVWVCS